MSIPRKRLPLPSAATPDVPVPQGHAYVSPRRRECPEDAYRHTKQDGAFRQFLLQFRREGLQHEDMGVWHNVRIEVEGEPADITKLEEACYKVKQLNDILTRTSRRGLVAEANCGLTRPEEVAEAVAKEVQERFPNAEVLVRIYKIPERVLQYRVTQKGHHSLE